jgi:hypothetical protein
VTEKKIKTDGGEIAMGAIRGADVDHWFSMDDDDDDCLLDELSDARDRVDLEARAGLVVPSRAG